MRKLTAVVVFLFAGNAGADEALRCMFSRGVWNPDGPEGRRCECSRKKGLAHASSERGVCEDICVNESKRTVVVYGGASAPKPAASDPPVTVAPRYEISRSASAPAAPVAVPNVCKGMKLPMYVGWTDEFACFCATSCLKSGSRWTKWDPDRVDGNYCQPVKEGYEAAACTIVAKAGSAGLPGEGASCDQLCNALGSSVAFWDATASKDERCRPFDTEHYGAGACLIVPKPAKVGQAAVARAASSCEDQCNALGLAVALWDASEDENHRCVPRNRFTHFAGKCTIVPRAGEKGEKGDRGERGNVGEVSGGTTPETRCLETDGTWLSATSACACKPGYHTSAANTCVVDRSQPRFVNVSFGSRFRFNLGLTGAGFWGVSGKPVSAPFGGGPGIGLSVDLARSLELWAQGGLFVINDATSPLGSFVQGGLRYMPSRYFGLQAGPSAVFLAVDSRLEARLANVSGLFGLVGRWRWFELSAGVTAGKVYPLDAPTLGFISGLGVRFPE